MHLSDFNSAVPTSEHAAPNDAARLQRLAERLPEPLAKDLPCLLKAAANPAQALVQLEALWQDHAEAAGAAFASSPLLLRAVVALFGASQWLGQTLLQNPDLLSMLARPGALEKPRLAEDLRERLARFQLRSHVTNMSAALARFKRREYVRIFLRELLGLAPLAEITGEISALSDVLIECALLHCETQLRRQYQGWPQLRNPHGRIVAARFAVLALGKLGGNELNYSSDIDLLYVFSDGEDAHTLPLSTREFFTRLAQELTGTLAAVSAEGQTFRVDLRLRPQGSSGEMVIGLAQALRYYRDVAADWELQALLKVRVSAGDRELGRSFIHQVEERIYDKTLSLDAVHTAACSLERIRRGAARHVRGGIDVKSDAGGLREIEFTTQCLQRVYGGQEPWLRSSSTLFALQKLYDKRHIGDAEFRELGATYTLLRGIEHRLQCQQGAQAHRLPDECEAQVGLLRGFLPPSPTTVEQLAARMQTAAELCARVLRVGNSESAVASPATLNLGTPGADSLIREIVLRSPALAAVFHGSVGDPTRRNLQSILQSVATDEQRSRAALDNVKLIERALPLFRSSGLAISHLARHPEDLGAVFGELAEASEGSMADQLRMDARRAALRTLGRTVLERPAVEDVLREYSLAMEKILQRALQACMPPPGFSVFAVGRLATNELDVLSDADLLFVRGSECDSEAAQQCAQALVAMLTGYTREGAVIAVDTRLRPHGGSGELVVSARQLTQYCENEAQAWEAVALSKLRLVAGDRDLEAEVQQAAMQLQARFAVSPEFPAELRAMRRRLETSGVGRKANFKTGPGGSYDIDFLLGLLEARRALPSVGRQWPERLSAVSASGGLAATQCQTLLRCAELFRRVDHAVRVVEGRSRRWLPQSGMWRESVLDMLEAPQAEAQLHDAMHAVRDIFDEFFPD